MANCRTVTTTRPIVLLGETKKTKESKKSKLKMVETSDKPVKLSPTAAKIATLREADKDFDTLVSEIDTEIENYISKINNSKSFDPRPASQCSLNIYVTAIPFTADEKQTLLRYLKEKYLITNMLSGYHFEIEKCFLINKYRVTT